MISYRQAANTHYLIKKPPSIDKGQVEFNKWLIVVTQKKYNHGPLAYDDTGLSAEIQRVVKQDRADQIVFVDDYLTHPDHYVIEGDRWYPEDIKKKSTEQIAAIIQQHKEEEEAWAKRGPDAGGAWGGESDEEARFRSQLSRQEDLKRWKKEPLKTDSGPGASNVELDSPLGSPSMNQMIENINDYHYDPDDRTNILKDVYRGYGRRKKEREEYLDIINKINQENK